MDRESKTHNSHTDFQNREKQIDNRMNPRLLRRRIYLQTVLVLRSLEPEPTLLFLLSSISPDTNTGSDFAQTPPERSPLSLL